MTRPCAIALAVALSPAASHAEAEDGPLVRALADRIIECCDADSGAIFYRGTDPPPGGLVPYFSHFGAYGLLRAYEAAVDPRYLTAADAWIDFYRARMSGDGTVTDFTVEPDGSFTSTGDMDSTDSYAAMYLWVVAERLRVTNGGEGLDSWLLERELSCYRAVSAVLLTLHDTGLTLAKPDYPIEYLMDNAEVITGLRSAYEVFSALGNEGLARWCRSQADRMEEELRTFYDSERGYFAYYRDLAGDMGFAFEKWYPDIMAQILFAFRTGRPAEPDLGLVDRIFREGLVGDFDAARPLPFLWLGLAAQRVGHADGTQAVTDAVRALDPGQVARWDIQACDAALELLTGGTRP